MAELPAAPVAEQPEQPPADSQPAGTPAKPAARRKRRLTYLLRIPSQNHVGGVNALALSTLGGSRPRLVSAGRDASIRIWDANTAAPLCALEDHTDWVNDIAVSSDGRTLVSVSNDTSIKVWRAPGTDRDDPASLQCARTVLKHSDYVKSVAHAGGAFATGACGENNVVCTWWDLETGVDVASSSFGLRQAAGAPSTPLRAGARSGNWTVAGGRASCVECAPHKRSVLAVALCPRGHLLATGSADSAVRLWDPRTGAKQAKLKGHADAVRCLLMSADGSTVVSGSADGTFRVWDVGQQRAVAAYGPHSDSVWALASLDPNLRSAVVSGSRDGTAYATDLRAGSSTLLFREPSPIQRICLPEGGGAAWTCTQDPVIHLWDLPELVATRRRASSSASAASSARRLAPPPSPSLSAYPPLDEESAASTSAPLRSGPARTIRGHAPVVRTGVLNDKRRLLASDAAGGLTLWDATRASVLADLGPVPLDDKLRQLQETISVPSWFTLDTRLGSVGVHLEAPLLSAADAYAADAGIDDAPPDAKMNIGEHVARSLLASWAARRREPPPPDPELLPDASPPRTGSLGVSLPESASPKDDSPLTSSPAPARRPASPPPEAPAPSDDSAAPPPLSLYPIPPHTPVFVTEGPEQAPLVRRAAGAFDGAEGPLLPHWAAEVAAEGRSLVRDPPRFHFTLHPSPDDPELADFGANGRLSAPRILPVRKVAAYVVNKLNLTLPTRGGGEPGDTLSADEYVEILLGDQVLQPTLNLGTIKAFLQKGSPAGDDIPLRYRRSGPFRPPPPAPPPPAPPQPASAPKNQWFRKISSSQF
eukprot:tig00020553_g10546.t1